MIQQANDPRSRVREITGAGDQAGSGVTPIVSPREAALSNADSWWSDCAWRALEWLAEAGYPFTAYDLTELGVPAPDHPARWGGLFSAAATAELIECVGYAESRRPSRSRGLCRVWRGIPQAARVRGGAA